jgi:GTP cyclohydrolase I
LLEHFGVVGATDPHFSGTPGRFVRYLGEFFQGTPDTVQVLGNGWGLDDDEGELLTHQDSIDQVVCQTDIPYIGCCPHHLLPVIGVAHIAYIPCKRIVGLSKLSRLVHAVSHERPELQERVTNRTAELLQDYLKPLGVAVIFTAEHCCMAARGIRQPGIKTITSCMRGVFLEKEAPRQEFLSLIAQNARK